MPATARLNLHTAQGPELFINLGAIQVYLNTHQEGGVTITVRDGGMWHVGGIDADDLLVFARAVVEGVDG